MYNFDEIIDRSNTYSVKWGKDVLKQNFGNADAIPMWVADMDFKISEPIQKAIREVTDLSIYGYATSDEPNIALANWVNRRYGLGITKDEIINTPGVVFAINNAVQAFTNPGDKILIQQPVYNPFANAITNNERVLVSNDLLIQNDRFELDLEDFEQKVKDPDLKMFILCSPHNPSGLLFTREELESMLRLCYENDVLVVSDEIHSDLTMPGEKFVSAGAIDKKYDENLILCMAPSKSFNIAGLQWSGIIIKNKDLREKFSLFIRNLGYAFANELIQKAVVAAYNESEDWLNAVLDYIYENYLHFKKEIESNTDIKVLDMKATYLAALDFRSYGLTNEELNNRVYNDAGIAVNSGFSFGEQGSGLMRFNLACSRDLLNKAIDNLIKEFK